MLGIGLELGLTSLKKTLYFQSLLFLENTEKHIKGCLLMLTFIHV